MRTCWYFIAIALLCTIGLHLIEFHHDHPQIFGYGIQAVLHGSDRKWWIAFIALLFSLPVSLCAAPARPVRRSRFFERAVSIPLITVDHLRRTLRRGVMHPKLCA